MVNRVIPIKTDQNFLKEVSTPYRISFDLDISSQMISPAGIHRIDQNIKFKQLADQGIYQKTYIRQIEPIETGARVLFKDKKLFYIKSIFRFNDRGNLHSDNDIPAYELYILEIDIVNRYTKKHYFHKYWFNNCKLHRLHSHAAIWYNVLHQEPNFLEWYINNINRSQEIKNLFGIVEQLDSDQQTIARLLFNGEK